MVLDKIIPGKKKKKKLKGEKQNKDVERTKNEQRKKGLIKTQEPKK